MHLSLAAPGVIIYPLGNFYGNGSGFTVSHPLCFNCDRFGDFAVLLCRSGGGKSGAKPGSAASDAHRNDHPYLDYDCFAHAHPFGHTAADPFPNAVHTHIYPYSDIDAVPYADPLDHTDAYHDLDPVPILNPVSYAHVYPGANPNARADFHKDHRSDRYRHACPSQPDPIALAYRGGLPASGQPAMILKRSCRWVRQFEKRLRQA